MDCAQAYAKHMNLKLAAKELGMSWQNLYCRLKKEGVRVVGDKLRYGSDRDKLSSLAEVKFKELVPFAVDENKIKWQSKFDFSIGQMKVDVKASMPRQLNKKSAALSWSFSFKKQSLDADFICCFCFSVGRELQHVLLVPKEFFAGLQTVSVSCSGGSKWMEYEVPQNELAEFFRQLTE